MKSNMGRIIFTFITFGVSLYGICAQNSFSQPSNTLDTNQDGTSDQSMKGLTFFEDNPLFNDSFGYMNPSAEKANSLPGWQSMIPHFIPHHVKIAHILMNRNQQTDTNSRVILGDIPELPAKEGIFVGGDPANVMPNDTSNIPVVSFRNAFQRNIAMSDNQVFGNGQQFFRGSQNDTAATSSIIGLSSIQSDSFGISGEINTSVNTIDTNNRIPSMQLVGPFNDQRGIPLMRTAAEFVDISDAVAMRPIGEFQDQSNQDSKQNDSSPTDFAKSVINKDAIDNVRSAASNRSRTANDGPDKPRILVDIVFPTLRPPVSDANLRPIERTSIDSGELFSNTNGVSGLSINEQSSNSKTNTGGNPISPELTGASNFNLPDGQQVIEFGGATILNAPATNNLRPTVSSNIISVPAKSSQTQRTQDMNIQQIAFPKQLAPVIDDSRLWPSNVKNAINADGQFGSMVKRVDTEKLSAGQGVDFGINAISAAGDETNKRLEGVISNTGVNSNRQNFNGFSDNTLVTNGNRLADNVNGINQDTIGRNGQFMTENEPPFSGRFDANMHNDQQSNTGMLGISSSRGQTVQGNQFRNDLTDRMQSGNKIAGGKDSTAISSVQNNMQPINDNFGPANWDIRVRQTTTNGNTNMPNRNGEQNMQGNVNPPKSNMIVIGNQQVAPNQDNERVFTGVIDQGGQPLVTNGQPVGENVGSSIRNGGLTMPINPEPISGNNMISGPNTFNNQFVGQTGPFTQPVMNSNMGPRVQNGRPANIGQAIPGEAGPDARSAGTFHQGNQASVFNGQLTQTIPPGNIGTVGENGQTSNLNGQVLGMQQSINSNIDTASRDNQARKFNQPMNPQITDNQRMNNQAMTNQNMNSIQPISMQGINLNQQLNNPGINGINSQVTGPQGNAMFNQMNPGPQGNAMFNQMNTPRVNGMNNPGLNGMNSQVPGGMNVPVVNGMNNQGQNGMNNPGLNVMNSQVTGGTNGPVVNGINTPGVNGMNSQVKGPQGNAMFNQMNSPGVNGINTPGLNGMNSQVLGGMNVPVVNGMNSQGQNGMNNPGLNVMNSQVTGGTNGPVVNGINTPGLNGMNSQVTGAQGNTLFNQMNNNVVNRMNSPGINGMNNPGVNGINNPGLNGMNNQVDGPQGNAMFNQMNSPGVNVVNNQGANRINNPGANGMNSQDTGPQGITMFNQMNSQGVNGMNSPGVNGMNNPGVNGMNNPGVNGMNNPGVNGINSKVTGPQGNTMFNQMNSQGGNRINNPGVNGINNPGVNGMNSQGGNGMNNPGVNGMNNPGVNGMNSQGGNGMNNPGANGMNNPGVNGMNSQGGNGMNNPGANGMNNPGVNGMNNPGVNRMNSQVPGPQGTSMFNQMNSQGMMQLPNGAGAQMNNMGTIQPSNGQVQVSGQQNNPWMMQGNFPNSMNGVPHSSNDPFTMNSNGGFQGSANMNLNPQQNNNNRIRNLDGSFGPPMQQPQQQNPFINVGQFMPMPFNG